MAYGQTGTGKTYTMGILQPVSSQHEGIIPRSLGHIFGFIASDEASDAPSVWQVTMSFMQIYLESVQDLLAPPEETPVGEEPPNLPVREVRAQQASTAIAIATTAAAGTTVVQCSMAVPAKESGHS